MELNEAERRALAVRLEREVRVRFQGQNKRAYTAAGVNSATWTRLVGGLSVKAHTYTKVVGTLWPETEGDWRRIPELYGSRWDRYRADVKEWEVDEETRRSLIRLLDQADLEDEPSPESPEPQEIRKGSA